MLRDDRGQTATELLGVVLVVSVLIALIASTDLGNTLRTGALRQACLLVNDAADCPVPSREDASLKRPRPGSDRDRDRH